MQILFGLYLIYAGFGELPVHANVDYCDKKMCPYQGEHIACGKTKVCNVIPKKCSDMYVLNHCQDFGPDCKGYPRLLSLDEHKPLILHEHNKYRSRVAAGKQQCFYPAKRMPVLYWDDDLAETAAYNARTCIFAHDKCRSTKKFSMAGQNIYMTKTKYVNITTEGFIKEACFLWYEEQFYANHTLMNSFRKTVPQTGHFTLMVCDRQNRMGCAFLHDMLPADPSIPNDKEKLFVIFTCNYSSTNIRNIPSYKPGPPGSDCKKLSTKYEALCEDPVDPNDLDYYKKP